MAFSRNTNTQGRNSRPAGNVNRNTNANGRQAGNASGGNGQNVQRSTPTDKMLSYAMKIASELGVDLPQEAEESFDACRAFIDANADSVPPTDKQVGLAERLADSNGVIIPDDVMASKRKLSAWIDEQNEN